jgi:hypothetical protein
MATASFYPIEDCPTSQATAIYFRERAKTWRERAAAVSGGAPQHVACVYRELADGYEGLAACYERRAQLERNLKVVVSEDVV